MQHRQVKVYYKAFI